MEFTRMRHRLGLLAREPLLHFLLLAALIFAADGITSQAEPGKSIDLAEAPAGEFARRFEQRRGRPPNEAELQRFRENWLREEVLYREGLALGLNRNDPMIRARVISKMQLLLAEDMPEQAPTDAVLEDYLRRNVDTYRAPDRYSFDVIRPGVTDAEALVDALNGWKEPADRGVAPRRLRGRNGAAIVATFGRGFLQALQRLEPGGPWRLLPTGKGQVIARLVAHQPGAMPALAEIRSRVVADWRKDQRVRHVNQAVAVMQSGYRINR